MHPYYMLHIHICIYLYMGASENNGTPKSSILIGFSIVSHPFWGTPIFGNIHLYNICIYIYTELVIYRPYKEHSHSHYLAPASSIPFPFLVEKILGAYDLAAVSRILDLLSHTHPE